MHFNTKAGSETGQNTPLKHFKTKASNLFMQCGTIIFGLTKR